MRSILKLVKCTGLPVAILAFLSIPGLLDAQILSTQRAQEFIHALLADSSALPSFVASDDLERSRRLGISYMGVAEKCFIASDFTPAGFRDSLRRGLIPYRLSIDSLSGSYARLTFNAPLRQYRQQFYFNTDKFISPAHYFTRAWREIRSKHFQFLVSDPVCFNAYCVDRLERFTDSVMSLLQYSPEQKERLEEKKLVYILCRDEEEIEKVTGFRTLGMYVLAFDEVVTTFNCHYHELVHQLVNFRLGHLPLFTHPFLQEGIAVALGGRGGREPSPILRAGAFLTSSGFLDYSSILSKEEFLSQDASVTYPVSGHYASFLIKEIGMDSLLKLYRRYSGSESDENYHTIDTNDLPSRAHLQQFVNAFAPAIVPSTDSTTGKGMRLVSSPKITIDDDRECYLIRMKDIAVLHPPDALQGYRSKAFDENFPGRKYNGEKYALIAGSQEIKIYNLYSNNLTANFVSSFSIPPARVPKKDGYFEFRVRKELFEGDDLKGFGVE